MRQQIFSVVSPAGDSNLSKVFNGFIGALILVSVTLIVVDTFELPVRLLFVNLIIQASISVVFTVEYLIRLWTSDYNRPDLPPAKARLRHLVSAQSIIDLLAVLPFWLFVFAPFDLRFLAAFRVLRVMRLLRISFYSQALFVVGTVLRSSAKRLASTFLLLVLLMLVASILMYNAEHLAQPEAFNNALSGFWWAMQTITTIGYGDIYPITVLGKALGIVIALLGIGMIAIPTGIISASFVAYGRRQHKDE
ncbi:MAG: ion transporter [Coriobacteriales bacterium]|nr:ion transporter [Coriobacteriales bacterium]